MFSLLITKLPLGEGFRWVSYIFGQVTTKLYRFRCFTSVFIEIVLSECTTPFLQRDGVLHSVQISHPTTPTTVDGRNPANHLGCIRPCKSWDIYHRLVQDFFHQQYHPLSIQALETFDFFSCSPTGKPNHDHVAKKAHGKVAWNQ